MNIESKSVFTPITITLTSRKEVELLLCLLLLAGDKENTDTNFINMFRFHTNKLVGRSIIESDEVEKYTEIFGKLLAELNKKLRR